MNYLFVTLAHRCYVQPQWVFDCVNLQKRIPVSDYAPSGSLPPHLSPFTEEGPGDYVPPERLQAIKDDEGAEEDVIDSDEDGTVERGVV